jgi:hypothetical protein
MSDTLGTPSVPPPRSATAGNHSAPQAPCCASPSAMDTWVALVVMLVHAEGDTPTLGAWAALAGKSVGSLRLHCYAIHMPPRRSLMFARLLRAVSRARGQRWDLGEWLRAADPRTLSKAATLGGIPEAAACAPPVSVYLAHQQWLPADSTAMRAIRLVIDGPPA